MRVLCGFLISLLGLALFMGCAPVGTVVRLPQFELKEVGLERFDPPGLVNTEPGRAVVRLTIEARNPNAFGGRLVEIDAQLVLENEQVARAALTELNLPGGGIPVRIEALVEVPVTGHALASLVRIVRGEPTSYRLEGSFRLDVGALGKPKFGPYAFAQGTFRTPISPVAPKFSWRSDLTSLSVGGDGLVLDLGFEVENVSSLGYRIVAPLSLLIGNQTFAHAEVNGVVRARSKSVIYARFRLDPLAVPRSAFAGRFDFHVSGAPELEVPSLKRYQFPISVLFSGNAGP